MSGLARVVRVLAPVVVTLYVVYLVVFLTMQVALQGVAALTIGPWLASRLLDVIHRSHHLT